MLSLIGFTLPNTFLQSLGPSYSKTGYNQKMPRIYLLKKLNPQDSIWKHYPEDDFVRWVGDDEEEARKNAARGSLPRNSVISMSPWLNKEQTSCELEYNSEQDGVAGVSD